MIRAMMSTQLNNPATLDLLLTQSALLLLIGSNGG